MDWLKDKKNQPIVAAALAVVIIGAAVAIYFTMFAGGGGAATTSEAAAPTSTTTFDPATGQPIESNAGAPGTTPMPGSAAQYGSPGTTPGTSGSTTTTAAVTPAPTPPGGGKPMEVWRADPFLPAGYRPPPKQIGPKPKPPIRDLPFNNFSRWVEEKRKPPPPDLVQPVRRMAGIIKSDRIYAIIETVGSPKMEIVQPGDVLEDRLAKVERIESDKVILRTMDRVPKYITVRMTSAARTASNVTPSTTGSETAPSPMGPRDRIRPGRYDAGAGEPLAPM